MGLSDRIETFILHLLDNEDQWIELKRNELASVFDCVPSQINYVLSTRFTPSNGYIIESRRGGGGYLKIKRIACDSILSSIVESVPEEADASLCQSILTTLLEANFISKKEYRLLGAALSDKSLIINQPFKNRIRAQMLKNIITNINEVI